MALVAKLRLYNPEWKSSGIPNAEVIKKDVHGQYPITFEFQVYGTAPAAAEICAAANSVKDGTTTPFLLVVVSADALDTDTYTDKCVRAIRVIGLTVSSISNWQRGEKPVYSIEEIRMKGITDVASVRYYLRVIHAYACDWGSGGDDAEGAITIEAPANTTLLTIAIGTNESNGGTIYGSVNREGRWTLLDMSIQDAAITVTNATNPSALIYATFAGENVAGNTDDAVPTIGWMVNLGNPHIRVEPEMFRRLLSLTSSIIFKHALGQTAVIYQGIIQYRIY